MKIKHLFCLVLSYFLQVPNHLLLRSLQDPWCSNCVSMGEGKTIQITEFVVFHYFLSWATQPQLGIQHKWAGNESMVQQDLHNLPRRWLGSALSIQIHSKIVGKIMPTTKLATGLSSRSLHSDQVNVSTLSWIYERNQMLLFPFEVL